MVCRNRLVFSENQALVYLVHYNIVQRQTLYAESGCLITLLECPTPTEMTGILWESTLLLLLTPLVSFYSSSVSRVTRWRTAFMPKNQFVSHFLGSICHNNGTCFWTMLWNNETSGIYIVNCTPRTTRGLLQRLSMGFMGNEITMRIVESTYHPEYNGMVEWNTALKSNSCTK